jgi:hypothetical protein
MSRVAAIAPEGGLLLLLTAPVPLRLGFSDDPPWGARPFMARRKEGRKEGNVSTKLSARYLACTKNPRNSAGEAGSPLFQVRMLTHREMK